ncbi:transposase family protein, partial [Rhizobium hidalgonense]
MRYENLSRYTNAEFKRLVGVTRELFDLMVDILALAEQQKKKSGRPHSLSLADQLLLTLNYLRCYKTQIQLSADYNLAESNVNRTIASKSVTCRA